MFWTHQSLVTCCGVLPLPLLLRPPPTRRCCMAAGASMRTVRTKPRAATVHSCRDDGAMPCSGAAAALIGLEEGDADAGDCEEKEAGSYESTEAAVATAEEEGGDEDAIACPNNRHLNSTAGSDTLMMRDSLVRALVAMASAAAANGPL